MRIRVLITGVILVASVHGVALAAETWHAEVAPPRPQVPAVSVDAGYPGPYIPRATFPITLRATAGDYGFDGYIGFHFRVQDRQTYDPPVIARAVLRPHQSWSFSTFASWRQYGGRNDDSRSADPAPREIAIEWRDRSFGGRAIRSAGIPPWTMLAAPLRVGRDVALSDRAQWYQGFSDVIVPLDVWLDLSRRVREAILGSRVRIVLFGLPRPDQKLDDLDRALVPVAFTAKAGRYERPWPYEKGTVATSMSWTAKAGGRAIGIGALPYIVDSPAATWVADEGGIGRPLPATMMVPIAGAEPEPHPSRAWPAPGQIWRSYPSWTLMIVVILLSIAGWWFSRRNPRAAVAGAAVLAAILILAARDRFRPAAGAYTLDLSQPVVPGIVDTFHVENVYGAAPLPEERTNSERARKSVTEAATQFDDIEVRSSETPMAMGAITGRRDWRRITRASMTRELGAAPNVRIQSRDARRIVIDYQSPFPVDSVEAYWPCGNAICAGETAVRRAMSGTATIRNGHERFRDEEPFAWNTTPPYTRRAPARAMVDLQQKNRMSERSVRWFEPFQATDLRSFRISDREKTDPGSGSFSFALPANIEPGTAAIVKVPRNLTNQKVTLTSAGGSVPLVRTPRGATAFNNAYAVPPDVLREALAAGGIVQVTVTFDAASGVWRTPFAVASIDLLEKKP